MRVYLSSGFSYNNTKDPSKDPFGVLAKYSVGVYRITDTLRHFNKPGETIQVVREKATANAPAIIETIEVKIPVIGKNDAVITTDVANPDTMFTLMLMDGRRLPDKIDLASDTSLNPRSRSIRFDEQSPAFFYRIGLRQVLADLDLPLSTNRPVEITSIVETVMDMSAEEVIAIGREEIAKISHDECFREQRGIVGFWVIGKDKPSSFARIYQDGMQICVIYLEGPGQIVISSDPKSNYHFGGRGDGKQWTPLEIAGLKITGSAHSAGTARFERYVENGVKKRRDFRHSEEEARKIFEEIAEEVAKETAKDTNKYIVIPVKRRGGGGDD